MNHNKYHNHECHTCKPKEVFYDNHEHEFPKPRSKNCSCPNYKTYGLSNPYYKCVDYYVLNRGPHGKQIVNRYSLEDRFETFLGQGFLYNLKTNINIKQYYLSIATWLRAVYVQLRKLGVTYSNLSEHDSAIIVIRRILSRFVCEEEMCKLSELFNLNLLMADGEEIICNKEPVQII